MKPNPKQTPDDTVGRIQSHGKGVGPPTSESVERRAREIAETEGRHGDNVTEDDRVRAWRELHDETIALSSDEARSDVVASSNPADMAVDTGHQVDNMQPPDEQQITEKEVREGLREAEHERMLQGQRVEEEENA